MMIIIRVVSKLSKERFSKSIPSSEYRSEARIKNNERGIWQRRFWEHTIHDELDYSRHMDYIHFNPVKYGLVDCVKDWPHSTFHRLIERGVYPVEWGEVGSMDDNVVTPIRSLDKLAPFGT